MPDFGEEDPDLPSFKQEEKQTWKQRILCLQEPQSSLSLS